MGARSESKHGVGSGAPARWWVLALALGWFPVHASTAGEPPRSRPGAHVPRDGSLEQRVKTMSTALELDANQQLELTKVLQWQHDQIAGVWNDASVPAAYRIGATRAISDQTGDRIRALLTDEQKKKYNPPTPAHSAPADTSGRSVEDWMRATSNPSSVGAPASDSSAAR